MAVTFTVETGAIVENANSFCTVAEADDVNSIDPRSTWAALDQTAKESLLMLATRWMAQNIYWFGQKVDADQPLSFPRKRLIDRDGFEYLETVVPTPVRELCARLAATFNDTHPEDMVMAGGVRRFRTDLVEVEWQQGYLQSRAPSYVGSVIAGLGLGPDDRGARKIRKI